MQEGGAVRMKNMLGAVDRDQANIEAERGETVMGDFDDDGGMEHLAVGGQPHSQGGTPLQVPEGSFVFSNTRKLKIGGPVLQEFGKSASTKKKFTPAELAKQYDLNRYKEILEDPDSDSMARKTAALMLQNYQQKLAKLALYQEAMKGFPQGVPGVAMGLMGNGELEMENGESRKNSQSSILNPQFSMENGEGMAMAQVGGWVRPRTTAYSPWDLPVRAASGELRAAAPVYYRPPASPWDLSIPVPVDPVDLQPQHPYVRQAPANAPSAVSWDIPMRAASPDPRAVSRERRAARPVAAPWDLPVAGPVAVQSQAAAPQGAYYPSPYAPWDVTVGPPPVQTPADPYVPSQYPWNFPFTGAAPLQGAQGQAVSGEPRAVSPGASRQGPQGPASRTRPLYDEDFVPSDGDVIYPGYLPSNHQSTVPWVQQRRNDGLYGNQDWDMSDFFKRHPWVKQEKPNFNPANANDVGWFQTAYNQRYHDMWGRDYFNGTGHRKSDSKFGQGTYSTPSVVETDHYMTPSPFTKTAQNPYPIQVDARRDPTTVAVPGKKEKERGKEKDWTPWWTQDKINLGAAFRNRYDLQKYMPTYVSPDLYLPNAVYYDPTRNLAENQGMMALQNMMNTTYAGPQRLRAAGSNVFGQGYGHAASTLGDFANRNVAVANQLGTTNASLVNNYSGQRASALDTFLKGNTIANQQWDNSVRFMDNDVRRNLLSGITNQQKTNWMNQLNPYFSIHPDAFANKQFFFKGGKGLGNPASPGGGGDPWRTYQAYYDQYIDKVPGADKKSANDFALRMAFSNKSQFGTDSDGDTKASTSGYYNPQAAAFLSQYAPQFGE